MTLTRNALKVFSPQGTLLVTLILGRHGSTMEDLRKRGEGYSDVFGEVSLQETTEIP